MKETETVSTYRCDVCGETEVIMDRLRRHPPPDGAPLSCSPSRTWSDRSAWSQQLRGLFPTLCGSWCLKSLGSLGP